MNLCNSHIFESYININLFICLFIYLRNKYTTIYIYILFFYIYIYIYIYICSPKKWINIRAFDISKNKSKL